MNDHRTKRKTIMRILTIGTYALTTLLTIASLTACDLQSFPLPTGSSTATTSTTGDVTSSGGGDAAGSGGSGGGELCAPEDCPQPADPECGEATCNADVCGVFFFNEESLCGFSGHCNGLGVCVGLQEPIPCDGPCGDDGECSKGYCNTYEGTCEQFHLGNSTACQLGKGHCNAKTGTCCAGYQATVCDDIADPVMCFAACANGDTPCTYECMWACPLGTVAIPDQGFCFPAL
jgi:hypothetical protein